MPISIQFKTVNELNDRLIVLRAIRPTCSKQC